MDERPEPWSGGVKRMADYTFELVGKIGSMALIRKELPDHPLSFNNFRD